MRRIFSLLLCFFVLVSVDAQIDNRGNSDRGSSRKNNDEKPLADSLVISTQDTLSNDVFAFGLDNLSGTTYFNDSLLHDFEEYDPARIGNQRNINLGNTGSATYPIFWQPKYSSKFELGYDQHDLYKLKEEDVRYYQIEKPFSKISFGPGTSQASFVSSAILARDFANGVSVSLDFNRINSESVYTNQEVRHTSTHVGVMHKIDSSRWAYSINYLSNSNYEEYNRGVSDRTLFNELGFSFRSEIPVNFSDGFSYQLSRDYSARAYYFIKDEEDSKQYFQAKLNHERSLYKYINESISTADSLFFTEKYITSELGIRAPINNNKSSARISYHIENKLLRSFYYLNYGINQLSTDLLKRNISELVVGTENNFNWRGLNVGLDGYTGTVYNSFLLDLHPHAGYNYKDKAGISFGFRLHTQPSAYQVNQVEITFSEVRNEVPFVMSSQEIYGKLDIPVAGFTGKISSYAGQNIPVLASNGLEFTRENIEYLQVSLEEKLSFRWFHFDNRFATQLRTEQVYSMPAWYAESELYFQGKLFGSLEFQSGINGDFVPRYSLPSFSPLYGKLYQNSLAEDEGFFYRLDVYAAIKVQGFRFFVKYENLNDFWDTEVIYEVRDHAQLDGRIRLGVNWELRN